MSEQENIGKPSEYELKYAEQIRKAVETGRAQRAPDGTIVLDPTKKICPIEFGHFRAQREFDMKRVARILSNAAFEQGEETFEESMDFGPPSDQWDDIASPFEVDRAGCPYSAEDWLDDMDIINRARPHSQARKSPANGIQEPEQPPHEAGEGENAANPSPDGTDGKG